MQKIVEKRHTISPTSPPQEEWLGTDLIGTVQVSSEDPSGPIENIFDPMNEQGWRAGEPGEQQIRIRFREPIHLRRIQLEFVETSDERTHEFVLRWASNQHGELREIVRQRWNFSPNGSNREREDFVVDLDQAVLLELVINPDVSRRDAIASLTHLRLG